MILEDALLHAGRAVTAHRQRSALTMLGITVGIASVILLTSVGEGLRTYLVSEFTQFGTNLVAVNPGSVETSGIAGAVGVTVNPLTLDDAQAISRIRGVAEVVPVAMGTAAVEYGSRSRRVFVYGVNHAIPEVWKMGVRVGRFLPEGDPRSAPPVCVLGPTLKRELFGTGNALGEPVRIAGRRFRVVGVLESKGEFVGFDIDDSAYVPVVLAQQMFRGDELQEIDLTLINAGMESFVESEIERVLTERHGGEKDFTVTTQTGMLESLGRIMDVVSMAVGAIAAISLLVGSIGILTMMWISVNERTSEIGLSKALGATPRQILFLYLAEAAILSTSGGVAGLLIGMGLAALLSVVGIPTHIPPAFVAMALAVSLAVGLLSGILPARRAARLDPVVALGAE
jgi:putative ABC transport system permease protein